MTHSDRQATVRPNGGKIPCRPADLRQFPQNGVFPSIQLYKIFILYNLILIFRPPSGYRDRSGIACPVLRVLSASAPSAGARTGGISFLTVCSFCRSTGTPYPARSAAGVLITVFCLIGCRQSNHCRIDRCRRFLPCHPRNLLLAAVPAVGGMECSRTQKLPQRMIPPLPPSAA